ncbi:MAG TPA: ATP-binding protein [Candidatus Eisenbacteria bacterium]
MTEADLLERLAAHATLGSAPRDQLAWMAAHGTLQRFAAGTVVSPTSELLRTLNIVLSGRISIEVNRGAGPRKVMEWRAGDVTGILPYSRMKGPPGNSVTDEPTEVLTLPADCFPEMINRCPDVTAILVHVMLDRARRFTTSDLHDEKMLSLGRLAAGLAHELNNPASALARSAKELSARLFEMEATALALGAERLSSDQLAEIARVRAESDAPQARASLSPLERADREEAVAAWMERHRLDRETAAAMAETPVTVESLERLARSLGPDALGFALRAIGAGHRARALATEVETAASRVHSLVAAIKGFTYMDQTRVPAPVAIGQGLTDTLVVLGGKARAKGVDVTMRVADDLPAVEGFGGELNQVWANLISNAIEAAPASGRVEVTAEARDGGVIVRVVDDGPGVPEELKDRIFDPFFTTKPQGEGTGLGLDITRRLVREHHGRIELDSRPGRTEFRVTLPRA